MVESFVASMYNSTSQQEKTLPMLNIAFACETTMADISDLFDD